MAIIESLSCGVGSAAIVSAFVKITKSTNDDLTNRFINAIDSSAKIFFKKYPKLFNILYYVLGAAFVGKSAKKALNNISSDSYIINLGSGIKEIRKDVLNVDFYPFENVDILADICKLPFKDGSVDAAVNEFVLEHVKNPHEIVKEMHRVIKPGGLVYVAAPFVASFHSHH